MPRLTATEDRALADLVALVARFIGPKKVGKNQPERVTIAPGGEARMMLDTNSFLARVFNLLSRKAKDSTRQPIFKREAALFMTRAMRALSVQVRKKLMGQKPISRLILTGQEAKLYFSVLEYAHERWSMIRKNYIETAADVPVATEQAARVLWIIRSLINVGHPPVERSRFLR